MNSVVRFLRHDPSRQGYRFFWLKYVRTVNLNVHCQPCLGGRKSRKIRTSMFYRAKESFMLRDLVLDESRTNIYYMCGVTMPCVWSRNFHLAFRKQEGAVLRKRWHGVVLEIENAVELQITEDAIDQDFPLFQTKSYRTCRNAQFAWAFRKGLYLPENDEVWAPSQQLRVR